MLALTDFFRGTVVDAVALPGLDHVIVVTCIGAAVYFRVYSINFKKSGTKVPKVDLEPTGPNFNFEIRRAQLASADLAKEARRIP